MKKELSSICYFVKDKIELDTLNKKTYISTENMLPDKSGISDASSLPTIKLTPLFKKNDILISNIRPYFKKIWYADFDGGCSNDVLVLRAKPGVHEKFLYYVLSEDTFFDYATATAKGTKMPRGDKAAIMKYSVPDISYGNQEKIAKILSSLDNKIALNNEINKNLEHQAQAIFESWFVNFEPFGGIMPDDYINIKLQDCTSEIIRGFTSKYVEKSNLINLNQKVNKGFKLEKQYYKYLSEEIKVPQEKFARQGDILLNSLGQGTLGRIHYWNESHNNIVIDQHITIIRALDNTSTSEFLYLLLNSKQYKDYFEGFITGTTGMLMLNISAVRNTAIFLPPYKVQLDFSKIIKPFYKKIKTNTSENENLIHIRESLLPKLISGEIDVSNIDLDEFSDKLKGVE